MTDSALSPGPPKMVTGLFTNKESAELAYRSATRLGYESSDIDVLMSEETRNRYFPAGHDTKTELSGNATKDAAEDGTPAEGLGGPAGGTIGTIAPALAGVGTLLLVPILGVFAAGPIAVALTAAGAVGLAGALIGALTKWGIPQQRVEEYEQGIRAGGIWAYPVLVDTLHFSSGSFLLSTCSGLTARQSARSQSGQKFRILPCWLAN